MTNAASQQQSVPGHPRRKPEPLRPGYDPPPVLPEPAHILLVQGQIGMSRHPELRELRHLPAREQILQMRTHDAGQADKQHPVGRHLLRHACQHLCCKGSHHPQIGCKSGMLKFVNRPFSLNLQRNWFTIKVASEYRITWGPICFYHKTPLSNVNFNFTIGSDSLDWVIFS